MHFFSLNDKFNYKTVNVLLFTVIQISALLLPQLATAAEDLQNPGFETGSLAPWQATKPADAALVVKQEGAEFQTYADLGITVIPKIGTYMLRIGTPKQVAEKQVKGNNIVSQSFASHNNSLSFAARLFSWEHRGDDSVVISLKDSKGKDLTGISVKGENGTALALNLGPGITGTCTTLPCVFVMDTGKSGDFINTGWTVFELSGLPTDGSQVTLEYNVVGGQNQSHATWAYFDNANTPPIARFSINRQNAIEGDGITLTNTSFDPDPGDSIVSNVWSVEDPSCNCDRVFTTKDINLSYSDNRSIPYKVSLTVTDTHGATDTVLSGTVARDGTIVSPVVYKNGPPLAKTLNVEVLPGGQVQLLSRFVDPGFEDTHTATWTVPNGTLSNEQVQENNVPFMSSGIATATYTAPNTPGTTYKGYVTITDKDTDSVVSEFTITVLDYSLGRDETNNNNLTTAPKLNSNLVYRSDLSSKGDIDIYEIRLPDGSPIPAGSEVLARLGNLQADLDLVLLRKMPDIGNTPFVFGRTPFVFGRTPFVFGRTPFVFGRTPFVFGRTPFVFGRTPFVFGRTPFVFGRTPWLRDPLVDGFDSPLISIDQIPLSEQAYVADDGTDLSQDDITLGELGLGDLSEPGLIIAAYSTNRGLKDEQILLRTDFTDNALYVAVIGNNSAFTTQPYSLQLETSSPMDVKTLAGSKCNGSPLVDASKATTSSVIIRSTGKKALFVTQRERIKATYGDTAWTDLETNLIALADAVQGTVISIPSTAYDAWDSNPCSIEEANKVATAIRTEIFKLKDATTEYVTMVGNDHIIPFRRIPDATSISNERYYTLGSTLIPGSPLYASVFTGQTLSDDYYVDADPLIDQKTSLYIPDLVVSRLVETPTEMSSAISEFIAKQGDLTLTTAEVTGYDMFNDGAQQTANYLSSVMQTNTLIDNAWNADDLRCVMFGPASGDPTCINHDLINFNAHFNHFVAQSAYGFDNQLTDLLSSTDVAEAGMMTRTPPLKDDLSFTLGCHGGMSIPDRDVTIFDPTSGLDNSLDFPQAMARQGSVYVASTGYGLAGVNSIAGTEKLLAIFAQQLTTSPTVGKALLTAKQRYLSELSTVTEYDEKASLETTLYGLPMYNLVLPSSGMSAAAPTSGMPSGSVNLTVVDGGQTSSSSYTLEAVNTPAGKYFVVNGEQQATPLRSIQPKIITPIGNGAPAHGMLITAGSYTDSNGFDPVIARPVTEWEQNVGEGQVCLNAFWPTQLATVKSPKPDLSQSGIIIPAQFRCTTGSNDNVTGIERIFNNLTLEVQRSSSADFNAPTINEVKIHVVGDGSADISIDTADATGTISRIVLLVMDNGNVTTINSGSLTGIGGPYALHIANFTDTMNVMIQVVDDAGNVAIWVGKGVNVRGIEVNAADSILYSTLTPTVLTATIKDFTTLLAKADSMNFTWNFGDGEFATGLLAENGAPTSLVTVDAAGNATFSVTHQYPDNKAISAEVKVTDSFGGIGTDTVQLQSCSDALDFAPDRNGDFIGCSVTNSGTNVAVQLQVAGVISNNFQYRVYFDLIGPGKNSLPDGKTDLTLKWDNGNITSSGNLPSLAGRLVDTRTVEFAFDLAEAGFIGTQFSWQAETQSGVAGQPNIGFADQMPDGTVFNYVLQ